MGFGVETASVEEQPHGLGKVTWATLSLALLISKADIITLGFLTSPCCYEDGMR